MNLPQLLAKNPSVIPAQEETVITETIPASDEKVYDKYWMTHLVVAAPSPTAKARMVATLVPARDVETVIDGEPITVKELMPNAENIVMILDDAFGRAATDENFATALVTTLNELITIGKEKGVLQ